MRFRVIVSDNFHAMDEPEYLDGGEFDTYDEALATAQAIIDRCLASQWVPGLTPDDLMKRWATFGDSTSIVPSRQPWFSARDYALSRVEAICGEREG